VGAARSKVPCAPGLGPSLLQVALQVRELWPPEPFPLGLQSCGVGGGGGSVFFAHCWRPAWGEWAAGSVAAPPPGGSWDIPPSGPAQPELTLFSWFLLAFGPQGSWLGGAQAPLITLCVPHSLRSGHSPGGRWGDPHLQAWALEYSEMYGGGEGNGKKTLVTQASVSLCHWLRPHGSWGLRLLPGRVRGRGWT